MTPAEKLRARPRHVRVALHHPVPTLRRLSVDYGFALFEVEVQRAACDRAAAARTAADARSAAATASLVPPAQRICYLRALTAAIHAHTAALEAQLIAYKLLTLCSIRLERGRARRVAALKMKTLLHAYDLICIKIDLL